MPETSELLLKIESPYDKEAFLRIGRIRWSINWYNNKRFGVGLLVATAILLVPGIIVWFDEPILNPYLKLAIGGFLLAGLVFLTRLNNRRTYLRHYKELSEVYEELQMDCSYEFTTKGIKYYDKEKSMNFNWSVFKGYAYYEEFLLILLDGTSYTAYMFERTEETKEEYDQIVEIVVERLEKHKVRGYN